MEVEEIEIGADLAAALLVIDTPANVSITELEGKAGGFPLLEDLPRLVPLQIWVPSRPRDLHVVSVDAESSSVELVWVEDRGVERGVIVNAKEGKAAEEGQPAELEQVEADGLAVSLGIDTKKTPETWIVQFHRGGTPIRLDVRGSRDQGLASALGLIPLSGVRPELVDR
jgi:hypothetical protein